MQQPNEVRTSVSKIRSAKITSAQREQFKSTISSIIFDTRSVTIKPMFNRYSARVRYDGNRRLLVRGSSIDVLYRKICQEYANRKLITN